GGKRSKLLEQPLKMNCPNEASLELPWTTKLKINLDINTESPWQKTQGKKMPGYEPGNHFIIKNKLSRVLFKYRTGGMPSKTKSIV
ncbi:hypothetical protein, partial [Pedobacter ghigonis]|uniref:hypothetical protein n=1 Tax=Pedobacter ghigonis TaxID=2730403 RepID=UPI001C37E23D